MNKIIRLTIILGITSSISYCVDDLYETYATDAPSQVISPNQIANLENYNSSQKVRILIHDNMNRQSSLEQTSGTINLEADTSVQDTISRKLNYPITLSDSIGQEKIKYTSSYAILADKSSSYVTYFFNDKSSSTIVKGIRIPQILQQADFRGLTITTFNIEAGLNMMIATGENLPVINDRFITKSAEALSQTTSSTKHLALPLFTLSTQSLTDHPDTTLRFAYISTSLHVPDEIPFPQMVQDEKNYIIDKCFSFAIYNPQTRRVYLNGIINSVKDVDTSPVTSWDYVPSIPGFNWISSALRWVGL